MRIRSESVAFFFVFGCWISVNLIIGVIHHISFFSVHRQMLELLEGWLRHKSDMVNYEAARAICEMRNVTSSQLVRPIAGNVPLSALVVFYFILFLLVFIIKSCNSSCHLPSPLSNSLPFVH